MIEPRPGSERGRSGAPWLDSRHSFSFADWYDPQRMGHAALRVLNEDRIAPASGFGPHPHRDMEILTWVLDGQLEHRDSEGSHGRLRPGIAQVMTAGTGIVHSEVNPSPDTELHLLQIWLLPDRRGHRPEYREAAFEPGPELRPLASPDGREGSLRLHAEATVSLARLEPGGSLKLATRAGDAPYLHLARGDLRLGGLALQAGDAAILRDESLEASSEHGAELLWFEFAGADRAEAR